MPESGTGRNSYQRILRHSRCRRYTDSCRSTSPPDRRARREVKLDPKVNVEESCEQRTQELGRATPISSLCQQRSSSSLHPFQLVYGRLVRGTLDILNPKCRFLCSPYARIPHEHTRPREDKPRAVASRSEDLV